MIKAHCISFFSSLNLFVSLFNFEEEKEKKTQNLNIFKYKNILNILTDEKETKRMAWQYLYYRIKKKEKVREDNYMNEEKLYIYLYLRDSTFYEKLVLWFFFLLSLSSINIQS